MAPEAAWAELISFFREHEGPLRDILAGHLNRIEHKCIDRTMAGILDCMPRAAMVISGNRGVLSSNAAGYEMICNRHCLRTDAHSRLYFQDRNADAWLNDELSTTRNASTITGVRLQCLEVHDYGAKLQLIGVSPERSEPAGETSYLLSVHPDNGFEEVSPDLVRDMFDLTPDGAKCAAAIASGQSLVDYCNEIGISLAGGRYHVHQALQRTGCANQQELIARILHSTL